MLIQAFWGLFDIFDKDDIHLAIFKPSFLWYRLYLSNTLSCDIWYLQLTYDSYDAFDVTVIDVAYGTANHVVFFFRLLYAIIVCHVTPVS